MNFILKTFLSALIIALVTTLADRMPKGAALIKSLPITSLMVFFIMYYEGKSDQQIITMSWDVLFMVIPSLILFIAFPLLMQRGVSFYTSMLMATALTSCAYLVSFKLIS